MFRKFRRVFPRSNNPISRFSLRLYREYRIKLFNKKDFKVLDIAGGPMPLSREYLNIDISTDPEVDLVANLLEPLPFSDSYVNKIISVATLEHFNVHDVRALLKEFFRLLKPDGTLEIGVPSLKKILFQYEKRGCDDVVLRYLHGGLKDQYDVHYFVVDPTRFIKELSDIGFVEVKEEVYDYPLHSDDFMMKLTAQKPS